MRTRIIALITAFSFVSFVSCGTIRSNIKETRTVYGYQQRVDSNGKVKSENFGEIGREDTNREEDTKIPWWVWLIVGAAAAAAAAGVAAAAAAGSGGATASATVIPK